MLVLMLESNRFRADYEREKVLRKASVSGNRCGKRKSGKRKAVKIVKNNGHRGG